MEDDSCILKYIEIVPVGDDGFSDSDSELRPVKVSIST